VTRAQSVKRRLPRSAATALLLALSTLPGCIFVVGDDDNRVEPTHHEQHWGWASDYDFTSSRDLDDLEARIADLEDHAAKCAGCCADKD